MRLCADSKSYECPTNLFKSSKSNESNADMHSLRPDIAIPERNFITVIELLYDFFCIEVVWLQKEKILDYPQHTS